MTNYLSISFELIMLIVYGLDSEFATCQFVNWNESAKFFFDFQNEIASEVRSINLLFSVRDHSVNLIISQV